MNKRLFLLIILFIIAGCNPRAIPFIKDKLKEADDARTKATEEAIKNNAELQELDNVCKQIPLPREFKLIAKHKAVGKPPALSYYYFSEEDFDKSDNFFRQYFAKNEWKNVESKSLNRISEFQKDNYRVAIQYGGIGENANYSIFCEKLLDVK